MLSGIHFIDWHFGHAGVNGGRHYF